MTWKAKEKLQMDKKTEEHSTVISFSKDYKNLTKIKNENLSPIQTRVITNGDSRNFNFYPHTNVSSEHTLISKISPNSPPDSLTNSPSYTTVPMKKTDNENNDHAQSSDNNTVVVYPKDLEC